MRTEAELRELSNRLKELKASGRHDDFLRAVEDCTGAELLRLAALRRERAEEVRGGAAQSR